MRGVLAVALVMVLSCSVPRRAKAAPTDMPATSLIAPGVWEKSPYPVRGTPPGGGDWFSFVRVVDFESKGAPGAFVQAELRFPKAVELSVAGIPALGEFGIFVGDRARDDGRVAVRYEHGAYPQVLTISTPNPDGVIGGVLLPSLLFSASSAIEYQSVSMRNSANRNCARVTGSTGISGG